MADEKVTDENEETPAEEPVVDEAPAEDAAVAEGAESEEAPVEAADPEPEPEEAPAEVTEEEVPAVAAAEGEPIAEDAEEAEPTEAAPAAEAPAAEAPAAQEAGVKPKRKRLPRPLRRQRSKSKRVPAAERKPISRLPKPEGERGRRQERQGTVVSSAMDKTIVVRVEMIKAHRKYKKVVRRSVKFHAHDERNEANVGDIVRIVETRPISATKHWRLAEIVEAAK